MTTAKTVAVCCERAKIRPGVFFRQIGKKQNYIFWCAAEAQRLVHGRREMKKVEPWLGLSVWSVHSPDAPRLWVQAPIGAHTGSNQ